MAGAAPHRTRSRGFTLVEVLVALLVLSIMAAMAWRGVDGIVRTRDASQRQLEQTLRQIGRASCRERVSSPV